MKKYNYPQEVKNKLSIKKLIKNIFTYVASILFIPFLIISGLLKLKNIILKLIWGV